MSKTAPRVAAIILAAGLSTRMAPANKLTADVRGLPVVRLVAETALASDARPVLAVTGHQAADVATALAGLDVTLVSNPDYAAGLSSSLKTGISALPRGCEGALILLGDMPQIAADHLNALIAAFSSDDIVLPVHEGRRGNPALWPARYFPELLQLQGDAGAKQLFRAHAARIREVDLGTDAIFVDIDTPDALAKVRGA